MCLNPIDGDKLKAILQLAWYPPSYNIAAKHYMRLCREHKSLMALKTWRKNHGLNSQLIQITEN